MMPASNFREDTIDDPKPRGKILRTLEESSMERGKKEVKKARERMPYLASGHTACGFPLV